MHLSSMKRMEWFIKQYIESNLMGKDKIKVLDVGSYDVNGTYKVFFSDEKYEYVGLDMADGPNVDIVPKNIYEWSEIENDSFDIVISGQALEHIEYPWLTMKEIVRVLKPTGICCIIAPSTIPEHRYPLDCYRYYPDGMKALAKYSGLDAIHVSTGGIPDEKASYEWDSIDNDTILIAAKNLERCIWGGEEENYPQLAIERRVPYVGGSYADLVLYTIKRPFIKMHREVINKKKYF